MPPVPTAFSVSASCCSACRCTSGGGPWYGGVAPPSSHRTGRSATLADRLAQLQLLNAVPPYRPTALPILDERQRGTKFVSLEPKSVLNSPQQTGVDFWSLNPYIGCEFGCTYCYARYAHRYTVERAHDAGKLT